MPISKTKELAKKLGLLKRKRQKENEATGAVRKKRKGQILSYVIIIDFESTCWKDKKGSQEIIEFPAVLLDLLTGDVVGEFQQYVQPQECPILSEFCKELTGISQAQVDSGVPLPTCLYLFGKWIKSLKEGKGVIVMEPGCEYSSHEDNLCAFATWSDWDLGVCLQYECRRKQIRKSQYFNHWIDLRSLYKQFYDRRPSGLCGSLEDLGIPFTGREHCGLDDARNTAKLCYRLVRDGCRLNITKSIWKKKEVIRAPCKENAMETRVEKYPPNSLQEIKLAPEYSKGANSGTEKYETSTTLTTVKTPINVNRVVQNDSNSEEWCGNKSDDSFLNEIAHEFDELEKNNFSKALSEHSCSTKTHTLPSSSVGVIGSGPAGTPSRSHFLSHISPVTLLPPHHHNHTHSPPTLCQPMANSPTLHLQSSLVTHRISSPLNPSLKPANIATRHKLSSLTVSKPASGPSCSNNVPRHQPSLLISNPASDSCCPNNVPRHKPSELVSKPASVSYCSNGTSSHTPTTVVSGVSSCSESMSFRTPSTSQWMNRKHFPSSSASSSSSSSSSSLFTDTPRPFNGGKVTPPLCKCGKRAKRKLVTSPGPNQGRPFFSCPGGRESGCQYFRWETYSSSKSLWNNDTIENLCSEYS